MRIYVATGFMYKDLARAAMDCFRQDGHEITFDWTQHVEGDNEVAAAAEDLAGVIAADVLVVMPTPNGAGLYVEIGIALGWNVAMRRKKRVIICDEYGGPIPIFAQLPEVIRVRDLSQARFVLQRWGQKPC